MEILFAQGRLITEKTPSKVLDINAPTCSRKCSGNFETILEKLLSNICGILEKYIVYPKTSTHSLWTCNVIYQNSDEAHVFCSTLPNTPYYQYWNLLRQRFPTGGPRPTCGLRAGRYWAADAGQNSRNNIEIVQNKYVSLVIQLTWRKSKSANCLWFVKVVG